MAPAQDLPVFEVIRRLAAPQHGVLTRRQLMAAGVAPGVIVRRIRDGYLVPLHRGVYQAGPLALPRGREMAACLACGPSAVISHTSAAVLHGLLEPSGRIPVHVTVVVGRRKRAGLRIIRTTRLGADEVERVEGVPVTVPARTLVDLAGVARGRRLRHAVARALDRRLTTEEALHQLLDRHPRRRGASRLKAILNDGGPILTRSEAEEQLLSLIEKACLPRPQVNAWLEGMEVDFLWRPSGLVVEVDGYAFHSSRNAFERDRRRDNALVAAGYRVIRFTWKQLTEEPLWVIARLAAALEWSAELESA